LAIDRELTRRGWLRARSLLTAIRDLATYNAAYRKTLNRWLKEGGTTLLRDELAGPARSEIVCMNDLDFFNRWEAIDTAALSALTRN
jgi:hypothetical protein